MAETEVIYFLGLVQFAQRRASTGSVLFTFPSLLSSLLPLFLPLRSGVNRTSLVSIAGGDGL